MPSTASAAASELALAASRCQAAPGVHKPCAASSSQAPAHAGSAQWSLASGHIDQKHTNLQKQRHKSCQTKPNNVQAEMESDPRQVDIMTSP